MEIIYPKDCDNAPKRKLIRDFIIAWFNREWKEVEKKLDSEFECSIIGNMLIKDKKSLKDYLINHTTPSQLNLFEILSHGKFGACNGEITAKNKLIHFAYFFEFKSAGKNSIKKITEYKIKSKISNKKFA